MRLILAAAPLLFLAFSGCTAGDLNIGDGYIRFDGAGSDTWTTEATGCGAIQNLEVNKDGTGSVSIEVRDGAGSKVLDETIDGTGDFDRDFRIDGVPGTWKIKASTSSSFAGDLNIELDC